MVGKELNNKELKGALTEIVHLATAAVFGDDISLSWLAIGDIKDILRGLDASEAERQEAASEEPQHDEAAAKAAKQQEYSLRHFSFANGMFPIHTVRTPSGVMGRCEINGREFSFSSVDASGPDDHACTVRIWDGVKQVAFMTILKGRSISEGMAMGAFKGYVKRLSGSNKYHNRGGFLKQNVKRMQEGGAK